MKEFSRIGVDLAKGFFQVHALEREEAPAVTRKLSRAKFLAFFAGVAPSRIGMEACGSAHYWARELRAMGHEVALIAPIYVKPYLKRGKNDANDAAAVCEAMSRPDMRFVPVKSADQQAALMLHKTRDLLVKQRTYDRERAARPSLGVRLDRRQGHPQGQGPAGACRDGRPPPGGRARGDRDIGRRHQEA